MRRSKVKGALARFWGRFLLSTATVGFAGWAWYFYQNVWQAAIPAFGLPGVYLAPLRVLLARYLMIGGLLLMAWWAGFTLLKASRVPSAGKGKGQRQMG